MRFIPIQDRTEAEPGPYKGNRTVVGYLHDMPVGPVEDVVAAVQEHFYRKGWDLVDVRTGHESYRVYVQLRTV
jgi:hypothetical protein